MNNLNYNVRDEPVEWAELLSNAQRVVADPSRRKQRYLPAIRLVRRADRLSNLALQQNFNYGLGRIMCKMAKRLQKPEERQQLIDAAALQMVSTALQWRPATVPLDKPFVPVVRDLHAFAHSRKPSMLLAQKSWADLPPAEQVLSNAFASAMALRRAAMANEWRPLKRVTARALNSLTLWVTPIATAAIAQETFTGASSVLGTLLLGLPPEREPTDDQLATPINLEKTTDFQSPKYFAPSARLRIDEFQAGHGWKGEGSSLHFDHSVLNKQPPTPTDNRLLCAERLGCPALFAGGLAMDIALNILPQVIEVAQHIVPEDYLRTLRPGRS